MATSRRNVERRYDIVLVSSGTRPSRIARTITGFTDLRKEPGAYLNNAEARQLVRRAPVLIVQGASYATAERARQALERRGATVELRAYDVEVPRPEPSSVAPFKWGWRSALFIAMIVIILIAAIFVVIVSYSLFCSSVFCGGDYLP